MNNEVLLDRRGDLPAPPGYEVIDTEVAFLRHATDERPLLIRGERLCAWAEAFYSLRGRPFRYQESLSVILHRVFPALSREQADRLARKMGMAAASLEQATTVSVLNHCYPDDYSLWQGAPSREHAARWLLWHDAHQPDDAEALILDQHAGWLQRHANHAPEAALYRVLSRDQARSMLWTWLGVNDEINRDLGEFPVPAPDHLLKDLRSEWMQRIIESHGAFFERMLAFPLSVALRQDLADLTAKFFQQYPSHLTKDGLRQLQPYLVMKVLGALEKNLPPTEPSPLPGDEAAVLDWFESEYLPFRRWQVRFGNEQIRANALLHAQAFARWYLERYPFWVLSPGWLSFQHTRSLLDASQEAVTFCVVLDGLPAWDAEDIAREISGKIERLQLLQKAYCFAPLPTVTEFAKDALLKGVQPRLAPQHSPLGPILSDHASPVEELEGLPPGSVVFWRVSQPDNAYHFTANTKRERRVRAEILVVLQALQEVVEALADHVPLRIIVTTDHGRLLNAESPRQLRTPTGLQAHGRVAWGKIDQRFDESGFSLDSDAGWVVVHGQRFEMLYDMLIAWGEESFHNVRAGNEAYPHGGLFPEEAIVPWFVFERDVQPPTLDIEISGKGEAENAGTASVKITNRSSIALECIALELSHGAQVGGSWQVPPLRESEFTLPLAPWPVKSDLEALKATLHFRQPSGKTFAVEAIPVLEVQALYERDYSLLKDLDL